MKFWGIQPGLFGKDYEEKRISDQLPSRLIELMKSEPVGLTDAALKTWREQGPLRFVDIAENSFEKIDLTLKRIGTSSDHPDIQGQIGVDEYGM